MSLPLLHAKKKAHEGPLPVKANLIALLDDDNILTQYNAYTHANTSEIKFGVKPSALALSRDKKKAFVVDQDDHSFSVLDLEEKKWIRKINVGHRPSKIVVHPLKPRIYVLNQDDGSLSILHEKTFQLLNVINIGYDFVDMKITNQGDKIYFANEKEHEVSIFDTKKNRMKTRLRTKIAPQEIFITPNGNRIYVKHRFRGDLTIIDGVLERIVGIGDIANLPKLKDRYEIASIIGDLIFIPYENYVAVVNSAYNGYMHKLKFGAHPKKVYRSPYSNIIYVTFYNHREVYIYDFDMRAEVGKVFLGGRIQDLLVRNF